MDGSADRVTAVINGEIPDRAPLFDLLRNDAVIEHFSGEQLTLENGGERRKSRWTSPTANKQYRDSEDYAAVKRAELEDSDPYAWDENKQRSLEESLQQQNMQTARRGDFLFMPPGKPGLVAEALLPSTQTNHRRDAQKRDQAVLPFRREFVPCIDVGTIHNSHPDLVMAGGIDVFQWRIPSVRLSMRQREGS